MKLSIPLASIAVWCLLGCEEARFEPGPDADEEGHSAPTRFTAEANAAVLRELPFHDQQDFEDAKRGLIASMPTLRIEGSQGEVIWDQSAYDFIEGQAPASVNPSLWRQASLNNIHGLFEVTDGIYQLRGFDLANITLIEGDTGWVVVDPATTAETAEVAWRFASEQLGDKPIRAIIFTHSHIDHFGGVLGLLKASGTEVSAVKVIAPEGFLEEATSENVIAGNTMGRRASYMYGKQLARSERGHVGTGLGKEPAFGSAAILTPTHIIGETPSNVDIDGNSFVFQFTPESEAPAELTFYLPGKKAFCGAEVVSRNMHNLYTLRGAKVRDALKWSQYIDEAIELFPEAEILFASHHWPLWGKERINTFLKQQRDTYKYLHDQTVRLAARGYTPGEIAEEITMPEALRTSFSSRGYYGTVRHNARAVYQAYFGWYDGNPANLNPLPPVDSAERYIALMGGADVVLAEAQEAFEKGEYRWVAELLNKLVFASPNHADAKALLAQTYDQLGYQAESGPWRDVYLTGAHELRHGTPEKPAIDLAAAKDLLSQTPLPRFFDTMGVMLDGTKADGVNLSIKLDFSDLGESYVLDIENAVLHHRPAKPGAATDASVSLTHAIFLDMITGTGSLKDTIMSDDLSVQGSRLDLLKFFSLLEKPSSSFNIVTP